MSPTLSSERQARTRTLLIIILALTALAYIATLQFQFVYDDESQIAGNPLIEHWHYVPYYFHIQVWAHQDPNQPGNYYRPIFLLWLRLNNALFGFRPFGWHLTTVLMHVLATFFVFKFANRLSQRVDVALVAALLFGLHPVHVEAVAWVSGVTEALFAILLIGSILCFLDWREGRTNARTYSLVLFALAIFSKETAVLMMPLVFAYTWLNPIEERPTNLRRFWTSLRPALPYLGVTFVYLYFRRLALSGALMHTVTPIDSVTNLLTIPSVLWFYLKLLFVPTGLSAFYNTPYVISPNLHQFWLPLIGVVVLAGALFYWWGKTHDRIVAFASVLLVLPLIPLMNFSVFAYAEIAHDRYLYTPSIGFALLVALGGAQLVEKVRFSKPRLAWGRMSLVVVGATAALYAGLTISQSLYWHDNLVLYTRGVQVAPTNDLATNDLANEFARRNMYPQAMSLYWKVLERNPNFYLANYNLGFASCESGKYEQGEHFLLRAAALNPKDGGTFYFLGKCEMQLGKLDAAEANLHRAIRTDPRLLGPRYALGLLYRQEGKSKEALDYFRAELLKNPNDADARRQVEELSGK